VIDKDLAKLGSELLEKKWSLNTLWQEIADNFYPERADFTTTRFLGDEFASNLMSSYPITCRRDLGNQFGTMLRPTAKPWFHIGRKYSDDDESLEVKQYLEDFQETMRRAMYDPHSQFTRATKAADHDYAAFGQAVISIELNRRRDALLYRCWHLRDMAWQENADGERGFTVRKWKPKLQELFGLFPEDKLHADWKRKKEKEPFSEVECLHIVCDAEMRDENAKGRPRWSLYWDNEHEQMIEAVPIWGQHYIIPRWQIIGSQYAYSPAVVAALPDARLIQAMTFTLLEVGEKASNPPVLATMDTIRSDVALYAGGVTWVDQEYDERLGEALRPLSQDYKGITYGMEMLQDTRALIQKAFFLDSLTLPQRTPEMTAYEVGQRVQQYIRDALPIFEPVEYDYNASLCEETFGILVRNGAFGSPADWPRAMAGMEVDFKFESPLHDIIEQEKAQKWIEAKTLLADAIALDPSAAFLVDGQTALREALLAMGTPAEWINDEDEVNAAAKAYAEQQRQADLIEQVKTGSEAVRNLSQAQTT